MYRITVIWVAALKETLGNISQLQLKVVSVEMIVQCVHVYVNELFSSLNNELVFHLHPFLLIQ